MMRMETLAGIKKAMPIVLGYVPVGFAFGVLAREAGLSPLAATMMSLFVYAGSGQLIAVGMLAAGAGILSVVITCGVINLRHLLMSASLAPYMRHWPVWRKLLFGFEMTDESFALQSARFAAMRDPQRESILPGCMAETFGINHTAHAAWIAGGFLGASFGSLLGDVSQFGLDYALPTMFIALLAPRFAERAQLAVALFAAFTAVVLALVGMTQWNIMVATIIAATVGAFVFSGKGKGKNSGADSEGTGSVSRPAESSNADAEKADGAVDASCIEGACADNASVLPKDVPSITNSSVSDKQ